MEPMISAHYLQSGFTLTGLTARELINNLLGIALRSLINKKMPPRGAVERSETGVSGHRGASPCNFPAASLSDKQRMLNGGRERNLI